MSHLFRWQTKCSGLQRRLVLVISISRKWDTMFIVMRCIVLMKRHQMHLGGLLRKEGKMLGPGGRLVISRWCQLRLDKVGTLMLYLTRIHVWWYGMSQPNCDSFVMPNEVTLPLQLPLLRHLVVVVVLVICIFRWLFMGLNF